MDDPSSATAHAEHESRLDRERARKRAKRACESPAEKERRKRLTESVICSVGHLSLRLNVCSA